MTRALAFGCFLFLFLSLVACGDERPVLVDDDGGVDLVDMGVADLGPETDGGEPDGGADLGPADMGPPPDMGPPCPTGPAPDPADPAAGDWSSRFYIPGAGGTAPTDVIAVAVDADDVVYVGGHFSHGNDVPAQNVMAWEDGVGFTPLGDGLNGDVIELELHPSTGDLWAVERLVDEQRIHRWDGTSWSFEHSTEGFLSALTFAPDGTLMVGGSFDAIDGTPVTNLAALIGGSWMSIGDSPAGQVSAILAEADSVCIGGRFANVGALEAVSVACHDRTSWTAFSLPVVGYEVRALARDSSGALLAGGHFDLDPRDADEGGSVARWTGSEWERLGEGFTGSIGPGYVDVIEVAGDTIYAAGSFKRSGATEVESVSRFEGGAWQNMGGAFAEVGFGLETHNVFDGALTSSGQLVIGGRFTRVGDLPASHVAIWDPTFDWLTLEKPTGGSAGVGGFVDALAARGPCELYAGGRFLYVGDTAARNVVRITPSGPQPLGAGPLGTVYAMAVAEDGTVYAGGDLAGANLVQYQGGATWPTVGDGLNGQVAVLLVASDGRLWVGGDFTQVVGSGLTAPHIVVWDGSDWSVPGGGMDGPVRALLELDDGTIVAGGAFGNAGAIAATNVAAWDGSDWSAYGTGLPADAGRGVRSLAFFDGQVVAGGTFDSLPDAEGAGIATWNGTAWETLGDGFFSPLSFSPTYVNDLAAVGDALFATGHNLPTTDGGEDTRLAIYRDGSWAPFGELTDISEALLATPDALWIGGTFTRAGPIPAVGLASFTFD